MLGIVILFGVDTVPSTPTSGAKVVGFGVKGLSFGLKDPGALAQGAQYGSFKKHSLSHVGIPNTIRGIFCKYSALGRLGRIAWVLGPVG